MCGFICIFNGKRFETRAASLYAAKLAAIAHFKPRKSQEHMIIVMLAERPDGSTVTHSTAAL